MKKLELKREEPTRVADLSKENLYIDYIKISGSHTPFTCILKFANGDKVSDREFIFFEDSTRIGKLTSARRVTLSDYESCTAHFPINADNWHDGSVTLVLSSKSS